MEEPVTDRIEPIDLVWTPNAYRREKEETNEKTKKHDTVSCQGRFEVQEQYVNKISKSHALQRFRTTLVVGPDS